MRSPLLNINYKLGFSGEIKKLVLPLKREAKRLPYCVMLFFCRGGVSPPVIENKTISPINQNLKVGLEKITNASRAQTIPCRALKIKYFLNESSAFSQIDII